ncbi:MAG: catechol 2,3-dioxygenase-like lactoylglutathione lyase family enzyme [Gammaproteobacteria bacterium]|jgi:catechol 2,3-dioxygenase-like lactoylglutathione lyase family enzyme
MTQPLQTVSQLAYVVRDLDAALKYWTEIVQAGPFFVYKHIPITDQRYRGGDSNVDITVALGYSGELQIELIYCEDDAPSVYKEFLDAGRIGVHHVGIMPVDFAAAYAQYTSLGIEPAFECSLGGAPVVYFDTVAQLGHFTEFWDNNSVFKDFFASIADASKGWDGRDPVRDGAI